MKFTPILNDLPFSYMLEHREFFVNIARSKAWGGDVLFFPPNLPFGALGCAIAGYFYGKPYVSDTSPYWNKYDENKNQPHYLNCTGTIGAFYLMRSGIILKALLGSAIGTFARYEGRKDGGNFNGQYIGDTIQDGDMIIFAELDEDGNPTTSGDGHIVGQELVEGNTLHILEGAYSRNKVYKDKACLTYTLNKSDMITGKIITIRPQAPYKLAVYGVIHTGDVFDKEEVIIKPVEKDTTKNQLYVDDISLNLRDEATTSSKIMGTIGLGYYDVLDFVSKSDYIWYHLGPDAWVAGVKETKYYPKQEETNLQKINKLAKEIVDLSK